MKIKFNHPTNRVLIFILVMILGVQAALFWYFGQKIDILWQQNNYSADRVTPEFRELTQDAAESLYKDGVVDPVTKRVYFPGLNIYVPLTNKSQVLLYDHPFEDLTPMEANFNAKPVLYSPLNRISEIPCMQRLAGVSIDNPSQLQLYEGSDSAGTVSLKDGRTLYLYKNQTQGCGNIWTLVNPDDIIQILKQAQSY